MIVVALLIVCRLMVEAVDPLPMTTRSEEAVVVRLVLPLVRLGVLVTDDPLD